MSCFIFFFLGCVYVYLIEIYGDIFLGVYLVIEKKEEVLYMVILFVKKFICVVEMVIVCFCNKISE